MYQRKTYYVEAWQFAPGEAFPEWLQTLADEGRVASHIALPDKLGVDAVRVDEGYWITWEPTTGITSVIDSNDFNDLFVECPGGGVGVEG